MNIAVLLSFASAACVGVTLVWYLAPRVFLACDRRAARARLSPRSEVCAPHRPTRIDRLKSSTVASTSLPDANHTSDLVTLAALCDAVARATRSGVAAHDSLLKGIDAVGVRATWAGLLRRDLEDGVSLHAAMVRAGAAATGDDAACLALLASAVVGSTVVPAAVDHAAEVLRGIARCRADLQVAVSHTKFSLRILTSLPFGLLGLSFVASSTFRASVFSVRTIGPIIIGLIINRAGSLWMKRIIVRAVSHAQSDPLTDLIDRVCVSLRAGHSVAQACEALDHGDTAHLEPLPSEIAGRVRAGRPLDEALEPLGHQHGLAGRMFADVLVGAERDGLPIVPLVTRIASEVRNERQHRVDIAVRQLPSRLAIPLVLCVLPAFLLTTLVPLVTASLGSLTIRLPITSPIP